MKPRNQPEDPTGSETILVVEDDELVRSYVAAQLGKLGYTILQAAEGADALACLRQGEKIDLLFTDMVMPGGILGDELAREAVKLQPAIKVLLTTGYPLRGGSSAAGGSPARHILNKPYRRHQLAKKIREVLDEL